MNTHTVTFDNGQTRIVSELRNPDRLPQPGDRFVVQKSFSTLAGHVYHNGDIMEVIERTEDAPHDYLSSNGNLRIKCPWQTSVWSCFDALVAYGGATFDK